MKDRRNAEVDPWLEKLAWLMDKSIPIGPWSMGLDPLLGLIPGLGDALGGIISTMIVAHALQAGVARSAVLRMIMNVATDSFVGSIPFVGDLFDFAFKANAKNIEIYRQALLGERSTTRDWLFIGAVAVVMIGLILLPAIALIYLARWTLH